MLNNPEGEVDGHPLVPEEVDVLPPRAGFEKVPEPALDPHGGKAAGRRFLAVAGGGNERRVIFWDVQGPFHIGPTRELTKGPSAHMFVC